MSQVIDDIARRVDEARDKIDYDPSDPSRDASRVAQLWLARNVLDIVDEFPTAGYIVAPVKYDGHIDARHGVSVQNVHGGFLAVNFGIEWDIHPFFGGEVNLATKFLGSIVVVDAVNGYQGLIRASVGESLVSVREFLPAHILEAISVIRPLADASAVAEATRLMLLGLIRAERDAAQ